MGLPYWSATSAEAAVATAVPTVADWPSPAWIAIVCAAELNTPIPSGLAVLIESALSVAVIEADSAL